MIVGTAVMLNSLPIKANELLSLQKEVIVAIAFAGTADITQGDKIEASASGFDIAVGDTSKFTFDSSNCIFFFGTTVAILQPS